MMHRRVSIIILGLIVVGIVAAVLAIYFTTDDGTEGKDPSVTDPSTKYPTTNPPTTSTSTTSQSTTSPTTTSPTTTEVIYPTPGPDQFSRIDCYPEGKWGVEDVTQQSCESRGCVYNPFVKHPDVYVPPCYMDMTRGYTMESSDKFILGDKYVLKQNANMAQGQKQVTRNIANVGFKVYYPSENIVRFKFYDNADEYGRFEVPESIVKMDIPEVDIREMGKEPNYIVEVNEDDMFSFKIIRRSTGTVLWDTSVGGLELQNQYLTISTRLPSQNIYGFGENSHESFRHDMNFRTWGLFARDQWVGTGIHNHYGVHPFYTCLEEDGNSHGVLLLNSNAQDYTMSPLPMLTYRTIGGILDFYMFLGPTPENVVQQYTGAIGHPYMPPYWALGFQLCRYGYNSLERLQQAVNRTLAADIPLDVQYADIDHYDVRKVFTIDDIAFKGLPEYFEYLRDNGMHTTIILDPCLIVNETNYEPYEMAKTVKGFIEWPTDASITDEESVDRYDGARAMLGFVWPQGKVAFPDYFKPAMEQVWEDQIVKHFDRIKFDALWIDMNEPANFGTNEERPWNWPEDAKPYWSLRCSDIDPLDNPEYRTMAAYVYDSPDRQIKISDKTLCMVGVQGENHEYTHYDVHSLYGTSQIASTLRALRNATGGNKRGLVVGRSTFPGGGKHSGHWLGDNFSTWKQMRESIIGMLEMNLFGFPYIGADICGFFSETTADLCKRWQQLGAFYPYSRNHNQADNKIDQDPANFNEEVTELSRDSLRIRYQLLPYLYTLFYDANTKGNTVARPLFHEFPTDQMTWGLDTQFLWGAALMITPILDEEPMMTYYLPMGTWYNHYTNQPVQWGHEEGRYHDMEVFSDSKIPLFYRGGYIIPTQEYANNTHYSRQKPFHLKVYLDKGDTYGGEASGQLFWDDGDSIDTYQTGNYYMARYTCKGMKVSIDVEYNNLPEMSSLVLSSVHIMTVDQRPSVVMVNGQPHGSINYEWPKLEVNDLDMSMDKSFTITWSYEMPIDEETKERIDCQPAGPDQESCIAQGCIWSTASPLGGAPRCYMNMSNFGYKLKAVPTGGDIELTRKSNGFMFNGDITDIKVNIGELTDNILRIKIYTDNRYEVPLDIDKSESATNPQYEVEYPMTVGDSFFMKVKRKNTGTVIWDTSIGGMVFEEQFLQLVTRLPSENVYGFGENRHFTYKHDFSFKTWPMFSRDQAPGWGDYGNLYGVHPYYLCVEDTGGRSHGVLLLNSNAMEVTMLPAPAVTYRTIGGILDFYIILGDNPEQVTQGYTQLIGRPYLPAYWSLGFQLCRYGYDNLDNMKAAVDRTINARIPYDVQYGDIDHFEDNKDFTWDVDRFDGLPEYFDQLRSMGIRTIIILDPAILSTDANYEVYTNAGDIFIKWPAGTNHTDIGKFNSQTMFGYVWPPGPAAFPDYFNPNTITWWKYWIDTHWNKLKFDGLWIDMNEPANFGTNEDKPWNWPENSTDELWSLKCQENQWDSPPYKPRSVFGPRLSDKTLCMVGEQKDGSNKIYKQYDVHSLYGWSQTEPTLEALKETTGERGIVISRSTYPSSGAMTGHWLGDNDSSWGHLRDSIIGILEFNLFGIPYIGADICGYFNDVSPQLCQRWMQVGAFYTYCRNHNGKGYREQDPAFFGMQIAESSRKVLEIRYTLLPYLYTLFYKANVEGSSVIRPLLHEFYMDERTYSIDRQFMWGKALLISPVLEEDRVQVEAYFPKARWFDYYTGKAMMTIGQYLTLDAPLDHIPLHLRGGNIIPTQNPANNTHFSRQEKFGLIVIPDGNNEATGELFWDDGVSIDSVTGGNFYMAQYELSANQITMTKTRSTTLSVPRMDYIRMLGVMSDPTSITVTLDGGASNQHPMENVLYNAASKELYIKNLDIDQFSLTSGWEIIVA